jgi:hypothetical protein
MRTGPYGPVFLRSLYFKYERLDRRSGLFPVLVRSSLGLWPVPGLDFQTLVIIITMVIIVAVGTIIIVPTSVMSVVAIAV